MAVKKAKKKQGRKPNDLPEVTCDFSAISRAWGKEWDTLFATEAGLRASLYVIPDGDEVDDDWAEERVQIAYDLKNIPIRQDELMTQVLRDVPSYYLLPNAPADIDWSKVASIDNYVAELRIEDLRNAVARARFEASKN